MQLMITVEHVRPAVLDRDTIWGRARLIKNGAWLGVGVCAAFWTVAIGARAAGAPLGVWVASTTRFWLLTCGILLAAPIGIASLLRRQMFSTRRALTCGAAYGAGLLFLPGAILIPLACLDVTAPRLEMVGGYAAALLGSMVVHPGLFCASCRILARWRGPVLVQDGTICPQCGYRLTGLAGPRCPECGGIYDPQDLARRGVTSPQDFRSF